MIVNECQLKNAVARTDRITDNRRLNYFPSSLEFILDLWLVLLHVNGVGIWKLGFTLAFGFGAIGIFKKWELSLFFEIASLRSQ